MTRQTVRERTAKLRAIPVIRDLGLKPYSVETNAIDDRGRHVTTKVSLSSVARAEAQILDNLNSRGTWGGRRQPSNGVNVTAALCGDPPFERSALYERGWR